MTNETEMKSLDCYNDDKRIRSICEVIETYDSYYTVSCNDGFCIISGEVFTNEPVKMFFGTCRTEQEIHDIVKSIIRTEDSNLPESRLYG